MVVSLKHFTTSNIAEVCYGEEDAIRGANLPSKSKVDGYRTLAIDIPVNLKSRLKLAAFASNRTTTQVVVDLLDSHLPQFEGMILESTEKT